MLKRGQKSKPFSKQFRDVRFSKYFIAEIRLEIMDKLVIQQCGSAIMANVRFIVDWVKESGNPPPDYIPPFRDEYLDFHEKREPKRKHIKLHRSYYSYLDPDEEKYYHT